MEGPLAVVLRPSRREDEGCAKEAAQVLVEAAFQVRTSWPSQPDSGAGRIRCAVLIGPDDGQLVQVQREDQALAVLLVQDLPRGSTVPAAVSEVVLPTRLRLDLARAAARWLTEDVLGHAADVFSSHPTMKEHPWVRRAVLLALKGKQLHVHGIAVEIGCSEKHLQRRWAHMRRDSASGQLLPDRFKQLLDVFLLLHALQRWLTDPLLRTPWKAIAQTLGVTEETLRDRMRAVLHVEPSSVEVSSIVPLISQLESQLLTPFER